MNLTLSIIFFFSGISALIYQITWQRLLTVYYGVGAISMTLIVSIYMLGLGLGALLGGRFAEKSKNPIQLYFWIELLIGIFGLLSFPLLMGIGRLTAGSSYFFAAGYEAVFLLGPTILMGMSLPVLIKIFSGFIPHLAQSLGKLYFVNTLGAAVGSITGSYVLISFFGIDVAIFVAAGINLLLAFSILVLKNTKKIKPSQQSVEKVTLIKGKTASHAPLLVFITGFLAIGYELVWFRVIGVMIKSSAYAFSSILAVYLFGIAVGSFIMSRFITKLSTEKRISMFYVLQVSVAASVAIIFIGYYYLTMYTPFSYLTGLTFGQVLHPPAFLLFSTPAMPLFEYLAFVFRLGTVFIWPMFFLLIPTILMGASFPLMAGIVFEGHRKTAWVTGRIYFFNIMGNVAGGLATGFLLLPSLGSEWTTILFILMGLLFSLRLLARKKVKWGYAVLALSVFVVLWVFPKQGELYRAIHPKLSGYTQYFTEGRDGVVMTYVHENGTVHNYINGDVHGGRPGYLFYVQATEAATQAKKIENVLIVGYGTGSIAEAILKIPSVKKLTVVELNATLLKNLRKIPLFQKLMDDPRLNIVVDDGRRFLQRQKNRYDIIFMSPLRATTAYSNNIYSQQFFELVSSHLVPGGIFSVWTDSMDTTFRTLDVVFSYKRLHVSNMEGFYLASQEPMEQSHHRIAQQIMVGFNRADQEVILMTSRGVNVAPQEALRPNLYNFVPAQDWKPLSEYYLGLWFSKQWIQNSP